MPDLVRRVQEALGDRYVLQRELGRGGMAVVYLATDERHGRAVAIKVLHPQLAAGIGPGRFLREIDIASRLTHPHILPLFDSGHLGDLLYYVMPYVPGESLRQRLDREVHLAVPVAVQITCDVASALAAAHQHGIVHRDVKPENILLEGDEAMVADFGIARALYAAAGATLSEPGLAIGTPAYMSPEQGSGEREVDGRSDVYSLGCVLYEMLAGEPPFTGATAQAVLVRHLTEAPRPLATVRPGVSAELEAAVRTALAKVPADRYATAAEFLRALQSVPSGTGSALPVTPPRNWARRLRLPWIGALLALAVTAGLLVQPWSRGPQLDASLLMVAPFSHRSGATSEGLSGDLCESLLHRAITRWDGLRVVDPLWVADARARHGYDTIRLGEALAIARERGAGRLATGEVFAHRDTLFVYAGLYDVSEDGRLIRHATAAVSEDLDDASAQFELLARLLVAGEAAAGSVDQGGDGTRSLAAWRAFHDGMLAFRDWELDRAAGRFRQAIEADPRYPQPRLWLAHAAWLSDTDADEWPRQAREAELMADRLGPDGRERARALRALGEQRFTDACRHYATLVARDSLDFIAWFGLGECRHRDRTVVPDSTSSSGWRFRASVQAAVDAYRRALDALPSSHAVFRGRAYARLSELFLTDPSYFRLGYRAGPDTTWFGAWPALSADTFALLPHPLEALLSGDAATVAPTRQRALRHGRLVVRDLAQHWAAAFPDSPDAREAHGRALEALGLLASGSGGASALGEIRSARRLAADGVQAARLAVAEVRVLAKLGRFAQARAQADSALAQWPEPPAAAASELAGVAVLTGRTHRAAALLRIAAPELRFVASDGTPVVPGVPLAAEAAALLVYAAAGNPADSIRAIRQRIQHAIATEFPPEDREHARAALLARADELGFFAGVSEAAPSGTPFGFVRSLQAALAGGRGAEAAAELRAEHALRDGPPGDVTIDGILAEARILVGAGDTAAATAQLDAALGALPTFGSDLVSDVPQAAALVQAMVLRAELARRAGDGSSADRWHDAVAALGGRRESSGGQ